jgi:hypothetical protein
MGPGTPCGPCTLFPDLARSVVLDGGTTSAAGRADLRTQIPNDASLLGASVTQQWGTLAGSACLRAFALSNAICIQIQ